MECNIEFENPIWSRISNEGKDLTKKLLAKLPELRISAKEALSHPWFTLENTDTHSLTISELNMNKYCNKRYFNVESIKPDFSKVKLTPFRTLNEGKKKPCEFGVYKTISRANIRRRSNLHEEIKDDANNKIKEKFALNVKEHNEFWFNLSPCVDESANFAESDISEKSDRSSVKVCSFPNKSLTLKELRSFHKSPLRRPVFSSRALSPELNFQKKMCGVMLEDKHIETIKEAIEEMRITALTLRNPNLTDKEFEEASPVPKPNFHIISKNKWKGNDKVSDQQALSN